jgi:hypothetical protein
MKTVTVPANILKQFEILPACSLKCTTEQSERGSACLQHYINYSRVFYIYRNFNFIPEVSERIVIVF